MLSSIKFRLTALFLAISFVTLSGLGIFLYYQLESITIGSIDSHLHSEVQLIAGLIEVEQGRVKVDLNEIAVGDYAVPLSGHYFQVVEGKPADDGGFAADARYAADGGFAADAGSASARIVARSASLGRVDASLPFEELHFKGVHKTIEGPAKKPLRLGEQTFMIAGRTVTVQASESLKDTQRLLASYRDSLLMILPAVFFISAVVVFLLARFSLASINIFSEKVGAITEQNLGDRLEVKGLPSELLPLAENFNSMMSRLEESFEGQRRFLSDASHQLRTPAAVIKGYCDVTLGRDRSDEEYRDSLEKINGAVVRMTGVIERILESARAEGVSHGGAGFRELDLMEVVLDAVRLLKEGAQRRGVTISIKGGSQKVSGDRVRLVEAVSNVVDNAIKYNREGGEVLIELSAAGGYAALTVEDSGAGIEEGERARVFERFYRSDETSAEVAGSGLGLSIVRSIVQAHGGDVGCESRGGVGTRFILRLPLA
ncbi:hypothetical protein MNBD_DELTA01-1990 [hydrothermal vent metagenome]|uniref:histidine kinase n=1 Tax=hydrothermal vent metagenome TaxID=652676 RepID=A0A3B0QT79_9ZZZZ